MRNSRHFRCPSFVEVFLRKGFYGISILFLGRMVHVSHGKTETQGAFSNYMWVIFEKRVGAVNIWEEFRPWLDRDSEACRDRYQVARLSGLVEAQSHVIITKERVSRASCCVRP